MRLNILGELGDDKVYKHQVGLWAVVTIILGQSLIVFALVGLIVVK